MFIFLKTNLISLVSWCCLFELLVTFFWFTCLRFAHVADAEVSESAGMVIKRYNEIPENLLFFYKDNNTISFPCLMYLIYLYVAQELFHSRLSAMS